MHNILNCFCQWNVFRNNYIKAETCLEDIIISVTCWPSSVAYVDWLERNTTKHKYGFKQFIYTVHSSHKYTIVFFPTLGQGHASACPYSRLMVK